MAAKRPNDEDDTPCPKRQQLDSLSSLPNLLKCPGWSQSDIASALPPLPKPADPELEKLAFAHISLNSNQNYEDLEWAGDGWIQAISTQLIYETFQGSLKTGRLSQLRELLVCNKTLGSFLREYGLEKRIHISSEILESSREPPAKEKRRAKDPLTTLEKIHGDVFEAYVGAILQSDRENGERIVTDWLKKLWSREIGDEIKKYGRDKNTQTASTIKSTLASTTANQKANPSEPPTLSPKVRLSQALVCRGVTLDYRDMPGKAKADKMGHNLFAVGVYFSGWGAKDELLAIGTALKKSEAGAVAAEEALKNKKLIKKYSEKKQAFLRAREAAGGGQ